MRSSRKKSKATEKAHIEVCTRALAAIRQAAPEGCFLSTGDYSARVLTRAGWASVSLRPGEVTNWAWLFVKFSTPCLARQIGLDSNENTGKWNHYLPAQALLAAEQAVQLFACLWPRDVYELAEAQFFGHVQDEVDAEDRRRRFRDREDKEPASGKTYLPIRYSCGGLSTKSSSWHGWCPSCGTDYSGNDARQFWAAAGRLFFVDSFSLV